MTKYIVTFEVDESKLDGLETDFETELGWLEESGIIATYCKKLNNKGEAL